ncbi:DUF47 family protein [Caldiplasma sukawensis]
MVNYNFLKKIMVIGEKETISNLSKFISIGKENASLLLDIFTHPENNINDASFKIAQNEKNADNITLEIKRGITSGAVGITLMENFLELVETFDDMIDRTYWLSREMQRTKDSLISSMFHSEPVSTFYESFSKILKIYQDALEILNSLLNSKDISDVKRYRLQIEKCEEDVDELKDAVIDRLYRISESISYLLFNHINSVVHVLDDLLDDCEDISDLVLNTLLSVSK